MHQEYEDKRPRRGTPTEMIAVRIPADWKTALEAIAVTEGDSLSGIVLEGVMRVLDDRRTDPDYADKARQSTERHLATLGDLALSGSADIQLPDITPGS